MPIDASIPLGGNPPQGGGMMNPLTMVGQWAQIQNAMNQNRLFQQTFLARQKAGQILANAPDLESGLQGLLADPDVAPFAGETINNMRQAQYTLSQLQNVQQGQVKSALDGFVKMLPGVLASPDENTWNGIRDSILAQLPGGLRPQTASAIESLKKAILDGLPSDPEQAKQVAIQRLSGLAIAGGLTPDGFKQLYGGTETIDLGDRIQPVKKIPEQLGGGFRSFDQTFPKGLAPQITTQSGVPLQVGGGAPQGGTNPLVPSASRAPVPAPSGNELMQPYHEQIGVEPLAPPPGARGSELNSPLTPAQQRQIGSGLPAGSRIQSPDSPTWAPENAPTKFEEGKRYTGDNGVSAIYRGGRWEIPISSRATPPAYASDLGLPGSQRPGAEAPEEEPLTFTGKPLFEGIAESPRVGRSNLTGSNILSPAQQKSAEKLMDDFQGDDRQRYDSMQQAIGQLDRMNADIEDIAKRGGKFLQTGPGGSARLEIAKAINLAGDQIGLWDSTKPRSATNNPYFDPQAIASAEDFRKEATRAGMALLNQTLGAQREAASVIFSTIQAVPGLDNTLLGNKLVSDSLRAASHRIIDQRRFRDEWASRNQGDLTGSLETFDKLHPGKEYLEQALKSVGLTEKGFSSPEAIQQAFKSGYLTDEEAVNFLMEQFPQFRSRR